MPRLSQAVATLLDTLLSGVVAGQPPVRVRRDGLALAVSRLSGRSLANATVSASGAVDLQLDSVGADDAQVEVKVGA